MKILLCLGLLGQSQAEEPVDVGEEISQTLQKTAETLGDTFEDVQATVQANVQTLRDEEDDFDSVFELAPKRIRKRKSGFNSMTKFGTIVLGLCAVGIFMLILKLGKYIAKWLDFEGTWLNEKFKKSFYTEKEFNDEWATLVNEATPEEKERIRNIFAPKSLQKFDEAAQECFPKVKQALQDKKKLIEKHLSELQQPSLDLATWVASLENEENKEKAKNFFQEFWKEVFPWMDVNDVTIKSKAAGLLFKAAYYAKNGKDGDLQNVYDEIYVKDQDQEFKECYDVETFNQKIAKFKELASAEAHADLRLWPYLAWLEKETSWPFEVEGNEE